MSYTKISEMKYERVSKDAAIEKIKNIISRVEAATSGDELLALRNEYNNTSDHVGTMARLASTRFNLNSRDEFYTKEMFKASI
jgi:oligoendopeptidase F